MLTVTRNQFRAIIEKCIDAAYGEFTKQEREALLAVGKTASRACSHTYSFCPIAQAGLDIYKHNTFVKKFDTSMEALLWSDFSCFPIVFEIKDT